MKSNKIIVIVLFLVQISAVYAIKICPECKQKFPDKVKFCPNDGKSLKNLQDAKTAKLTLSITPVSAKTCVDDLCTYSKGLLEIDLPAGDHSISVEAPDYNSQTFQITLFPDQHFKMAVSLSPMAKVSTAPEVIPTQAIDSELKNVIASVDTKNMVRIKGGSYKVGSERGNYDERPVRKVEIGDIFIDAYEVTCSEYAEYLDSIRKEGHRWCHPLEPVNKDHTPFHTYAWALRFSWIGGKPPAGMEGHPVVLVDWFDAWSYSKWAGKRLPTEWEWEIAAGSGEGKDYPWGNTFSPEKANIGDYPVKAGLFPDGISNSGAFDMAGNVAEWTSSAYDKDPRESKDFTGHFGQPVIKGGSWDDESRGCRISARDVRRSPFYRSTTVGFRCVADAPAFNR
ncbi:MAG: SUMF1/EgtB/PvdO family nonheme iron enzyme [Candidatus Riflebacteria bacterium]|nr:SUMF1/EgtB/PvdO family nonheme iron enzyme [Candidatus Riflebacteria bacterium]